MEKQERRAAVGTVLWMLCVQFMVVEQIVSRGWDGTYSFAYNYVSDLGAVNCDLQHGMTVCSPHHAWMNASFALQGVLIAVGALLVRGVFSPRRSYTVALGVLAASGMALIGVAAFPEDVRPMGHVMAAMAHFVLGGAGIVTMGVLLLRDARKSAIAGWLSLGVGGAVVLATVLLALQKEPIWNVMGLMEGAVERIAAYGIPLWFAGMGAGLLVRRLP